MTTNVLIRRLDAADAEAFRVLRLEALARNPEAFQATLGSEAALSLDQIGERLTRAAVFGALSRQDLVGIAGFLVQEGEKVRHKGVLWGMYVRPNARGQGIATALAERVIAHARSEVEILGLSVITENPAARRLYERLGFAAYGTEPRAMKQGDIYYDEVLLAKRLD